MVNNMPANAGDTGSIPQVRKIPRILLYDSSDAKRRRFLGREGELGNA